MDLKHILQLGVGSQHLKQKIDFPPGKIVTLLAYIFTKEKALVKIIFGHNFFICQHIFRTFVALFRTFGCNGMIMMFQKKGICKKAVSKGCCKESSKID